MLKRVNFVTVPVKDQDRALEFYTKKLGFKVFTDQTMGPTRWIELQLPSGETRVVLHPMPPGARDGQPTLALLADNVKATYEELTAKGVEFAQPPKKEHWGEYATFKDSEGNLVLFAKG